MNCAIRQMECYSNGLVPVSSRQQQFFGISLSREAEKPGPVIGRSSFFTKDDKPITSSLIECGQLLTEPQSYHSAADHDNGLLFCGTHQPTTLQRNSAGCSSASFRKTFFAVDHNSDSKEVLIQHPSTSNCWIPGDQHTRRDFTVDEV
jgi:hypothetical protein